MDSPVPDNKPDLVFHLEAAGKITGTITKTEGDCGAWVLVEFVPDFEGGEQRELACAEIRGARIEGMTADYSLVVREGPNPLANTPAWETAGDIINHDRAQTVWALVNKVSMFGWLAATRNGSPADDLRIVAGPESFPESAAERIRQIAEGGGRVALRPRI